MKFDAVIIGAGSAGAMSALALGKKGFDVVFVDRKSKEKIGKKVCGDAIARHHLDISKKEVGFGYPKGDELRQEIDGMDVYSPDGNYKLRLTISDDDGWIIDRHLFGQRLVKSALDAGAELLDSTSFKGLLTKNHSLRGVQVKQKDGKLIELEGNVIVDATGSSAVLRRSLPDRYYSDLFIEKEITPRDMGFAYREILKTKNPLEDDRFLRLYFINSLVPGGYVWIFPIGRGYCGANAGAGGDLARMRNPREKFKLFTDNYEFFNGSKTLDAGSGKVPIRRPLNTLVGDNFMLVGDTGSQVNPLHGGGLGVSIEAGIKLANTYEKASESDDYTATGLWSYNTSYNRESGTVHAPLDIFRQVVVSFSDKVWNVALKNGVISQEDVDELALKKKFEFSNLEKAKKLWRGKTIVRAVFKLRMLGKKMSQIAQVYKSYPDKIEDLPEWIENVNNVYKGL
ncbi:MAG: geranylgeranyl reductase family protein [Candidatus Hodarchaeales archaeon]|jgi:geranylgeranyl reductase family protein